MNVTNFKTQSAIMMQIEIDEWKSGNKKWTVANQFDEFVLESAIENMDKMSEERWEWWANADASIMSLAHELSQFDVEPLDSVWVD